MGRHNMNRCQWRGRNKCQSAGAPGPVLSICLAVKRTFNLIHASNPSPEWKYELSFQPSQLDRSEHETHVAGMPIHLPEGRIPASISLSLSLSISLLISIFFFQLLWLLFLSPPLVEYFIVVARFAVSVFYLPSFSCSLLHTLALLLLLRLCLLGIYGGWNRKTEQQLQLK